MNKYNRNHHTAIILAKQELAKTTHTATDFKVIDEQPREQETLYVVQYRITGHHSGTTSMNIVLKD